jgi:hypothetical protein
MDAVDLAGLLALGFVAGMSGGVVGAGSGVLFMPALVLFAGLSRLGAESHLARGHRAGVRGRDPAPAPLRPRRSPGRPAHGTLSPVGVLVGVALANAVSERVLS